LAVGPCRAEPLYRLRPKADLHGPQTGEDGKDRWWRNFAERRYASALTATPAGSGRIVEHQGILTNIFQIAADEGHLVYQLTGFAVFGIPMPR
jgi:hypothetical protein